GNLDLNVNGEYYRGMITEPLCQMITAEKEKTLTMPTGQTQHMTFDLTDNEIEWDENSSWVSSVTRLPDSTNDTLNIFIYPSADSRNIAGVVVGVAAQYSLPSSKAMQVNQNSMNVYGSGTSDAVFYYTGLPANNMQNLTDLKVRCRNARILFDHALVQQVRDGVVVANYIVFLGGASAQLGLRAAPQSGTTVSDPTCQKMLLAFGTDTKEMTLFNSDTNVNDIAVSVKYKSTLDHGLNDYYSPYVYLTDVGIGKISPGMMAEIPLEIPYLSEVTEYWIVSFGNITANVDAALITNYTYSSKNIDSNGKTDHVGLNQTGCYSFARSYAVTNQITPCSRTSADITGNGIVELVDLAFTTAEAEAGMASGTDSPVQMIVTYSDSSAAVHSRLFDDIREYIQISDEQTRTEAEVDSKQFKAGKISRVRFFLPNCENIESIRLIPKNDEGTASWRLAKIEGSLMFGNVDLDRVIDQQITQSENGIEIKYTNVSMRTYVYTGDKGEWVFDHSHGTVVGSEKSAVIMVYVDDGFDVKAVWNVEGQPDVSDTTLFNITSDSVTFVAPKNSSSTVQTYQITITSRKNNAYKDVITVSVPVPEPEKIEPATHEAGSSDSNTQENETESVQQPAESTTSPQEENTNNSEETTDSADSTQNEEQ
ncbi:MAG TPA: hypothetical protein DCZ71_07050, partial [Ruminococcus sp.]|nr:hypothetical protein [Ruminococcus sp.]